MTQKKLASRLRLLIVCVGIAILLLVTLLLPTGEGFPRLFHTVFWVFAAIPPFIGLGFSWKIAGNIRSNRSFSSDNVRYLHHISTLAAVDAAYLFLGAVLLYIGKYDTFSDLILYTVISGIAVVCSVVFAALSHLLQKAVALQNESDLTI